MARKRNYNLSSAHALLISSEGRNSPKSGEPGHTILQHVGGTEAQVGGRLKASVEGTTTAPIIMDPTTGALATRAQTIDIYVSAGLHSSKTKAGKAYDEAVVAPKDAAGAFLDQQQAARALLLALNSSVGQTALSNLDGGSKREFFTADVTSLSINGKPEARRMYCASRGAGGADMSDMSHMDEFTSVTVGIDRMGGDGVHLQTLYPVK